MTPAAENAERAGKVARLAYKPVGLLSGVEPCHPLGGRGGPGGVGAGGGEENRSGDQAHEGDRVLAHR